MRKAKNLMTLSKIITYKGFKVIYRKNHAATVYGGRAWTFKSLAECKRWINIVRGEA